MDHFKIYYPLLLLLLYPLSNKAQVPADRQFSTQEVERRLITEHREIFDQKIAIENHISSFSQTGETKPLTIPVVFHLIEQPGAPTITFDQVQSQLDLLNADFNILSPDIGRLKGDYAEFIDRAAVPQITFCLSGQPGSSAAFPGIFFRQSGVAYWQSDDRVKNRQSGGSDPLDTRQYLNIWVCNLVEGHAGYAQMPGGPAATDGVVINARYFGIKNDRNDPFGRGKTLTHLVASYLGLYELWNSLEPCFDDRVYDTPVHNDPNAGAGIEGRHVSTCYGHELEMYMNFMDNTEDSLLCMFTRGQVLRMQGMLSEGGPRNGLVANSACTPDPDLETLLSEQPVDANPKLEVYPNPSNSYLYIEVSRIQQGEVRMEVLNNTGQSVWTYSESCLDGRLEQSVQCANWPAGIYTVLVKQNGRILSKNVVVQ